MPPSSGRLNHRIQIQRRDQRQDAGGQPAITWTTVFTVWAEVVCIGGSENYRGQQFTPEVTDVVTIRYLSGVTAALHRIETDDGRFLDILAVVPPPRPIDDTVTLHCKERMSWQPVD